MFLHKEDAKEENNFEFLFFFLSIDSGPSVKFTSRTVVTVTLTILAIPPGPSHATLSA